MPVAWFLADYEPHTIGSRVYHRLAFNRATEQVFAAGGDWSEAEIDGGVALVRCRAPLSLLSDIATTFERVRDQDVRDIWTPTRRSLDGRGFQTRRVDELVADVQPDDHHDDVRYQVEKIAKLADDVGYVRLEGGLSPENRRLLVKLGELGYGLDRVSTGTFPTTGVLDNFNRADGALGANWTNPVYGSGVGAWTIISNQAGIATLAERWSGWNVAGYGNESEVYVTLSTLPTTVTDNNVNVMSGSAFASASTGYLVAAIVVSSAWVTQLYRVDSGLSFVQLGADISTAWASGNILGMERTGTDINAYRNTGSWALVGTRSSATYTVTGYLSMDTFPASGSGVRVDDFSGGTITSEVVTPSGTVGVSSIRGHNRW